MDKHDVDNAQGFALHCRAISNRGSHFEVLRERESFTLVCLRIIKHSNPVGNQRIVGLFYRIYSNKLCLSSTSNVACVSGVRRGGGERGESEFWIKTEEWWWGRAKMTACYKDPYWFISAVVDGHKILIG